LSEADEETTPQELVYRIESFFTKAYDISHEEIVRYLQDSGFEAAVEVTCFVCGTDLPEIFAEKLEVAEGIRSYLCDSCNQIRLHGTSTLRDYSQLSDEEKRLLEIVRRA
jgi:hypothetical protein